MAEVAVVVVVKKVVLKVVKVLVRKKPRPVYVKVPPPSSLSPTG